MNIVRLEELSDVNGILPFTIFSKKELSQMADCAIIRKINKNSHYIYLKTSDFAEQRYGSQGMYILSNGLLGTSSASDNKDLFFHKTKEDAEKTIETFRETHKYIITSNDIDFGVGNDDVKRVFLRHSKGYTHKQV